MRVDGARHAVEGRAEVARGLGDVGREQQEGDALGLAQRRVRARRSRAQAGQGALALARSLPVRGDARRLALRGLDALRDLRMQMARDERRHAAEHGLEDEVVREVGAEQNLLRLKLVPRVGELQGALPQHLLGQHEAEVDAGDSGQARQHQRRRAQPRELLRDQLGQRLRPRQLGVRARVQAALGPGELERLQRKERVAAAALAQCGGDVLSNHAGKVQRVHQRGHLRHVQRLHDHARERRGRSQCVEQGLQGRARLGWTQAQAPARRRGAARCGEQALQQLDARAVGEVHVVEHEAGDAGASALQQLGHGLGHRRARRPALALARRSLRCIELNRQRRQQRREITPQPRIQRFGHTLDKGEQEPREARVRHQRIARTSRREDQCAVFGGERLQQARLAHAGLAADDDHAAGSPALAQRLQLGVAADEARRAQHGHGHGLMQGLLWRARRRVVARLRFDGLQQRQRVHAWCGADLVLEQRLAAVEGQHRSSAVAAQVVQAHDAAVRVFRQWLGVEQSQRQGQRRGHVARRFERCDARLQALARLRLALRALAREPGRELWRIAGRKLAQQRGCTGEVVRHLVRPLVRHLMR